MIKVKVCGIRDSRNAREVADTGPDFMGFIFHPGSKRYVGANPGSALFQQVTAGIIKAGVFVDEEPERILEVAGMYALEIIQLHGTETSEFCRILHDAGYRVIKAFGMDKDFNFNRLEHYIPVCDYFLFDTKSAQHGGTGIKFNWEKLQHYNYNIPFFLSGGIGPEDAAAIRYFNHPALYAIDINSRFETEPGIKDVKQVKAFINEIKTVEP